MVRPDFNLLLTLDVVLAEANVARAAKRLHLSPSAMSRALARLRATIGDPLLVMAGRVLVPTPRALELRARAAQLVQDVEAVLRPGEALDLRRLARTFTLRSSEGFVENFGPALLARVRREAPAARLRFLPKADKDSAALRTGGVDLETGVVEASTGAELRSRALFVDRLVGVVARGHALARGRVTLVRYLAAEHVAVSRQGPEQWPIDAALREAGHTRSIVVTVGGFATAVALAAAGQLVASVPERHTGALRAGLHTFPLPLATSLFTVSLLWHPRHDADPAHRWLRECVRAACAAPAGAKA